MRPTTCTCLIALWLLAGPAPARAADASVTIYRCVDAKGQVSLRDDSCPKDTTQQSTRSMVRPQDAPTPPAPPAPPPPAPPPEPEVVEQPLIPPPPLYECTSYDGIVRESEVYDTNPHCEPLALYFPDPRGLTPAQANSCRWVQDSCVRLDDAETCARFRKKKREAASALLHTFSDTEAYRRSELQRLTQIIDESCH